LGSTTSDEFYKSNKFIVESKKVGPTIADDIKRSALNSTIVAIIAIFLYLLIRFRKWEYSLGASLAVLHDVLVIISVFSLFYTIMPFPLEVDQNFIAALLTIVGYSINDTVVVFDRLREYLNESKSEDTEEVINNAINSTLSRTIITAVTTIFVVVVLFIFGGEAIKGFSFALLIGLVVGTYSSIGIAASVVIDFRKKKTAEIAE
jgi:SecD/SecF fusion protein